MRIALFALILLVSVAAVAQQCDVPVNAIRPSGEAIANLTTGDFSADLNKQPVTVDSVTLPAQPQRIVLVIDTARKMTPAGRSVQEEFARGLVNGAKADDTVALLTGSSKDDVKFGADRSRVRDGISNMSNGGRSDKKGGTLDRIAEAITWFGDARPGDTVIVIALDLLDDHKASVKDVARQLAEHHVRLFGVAFGVLQVTNPTSSRSGTTFSAWSQVTPGMPINDSATGDPDFLPLAVNSGGYIAPQTFVPKTEADHQRIQKTAEMMTRLIDQPYQLRFKSSNSRMEPLVIKLKDSTGAQVLYPHNLGVCH